MAIWSTVLFAIAFLMNVNADVTTQACDSGSGVCVAFSIPVTPATTPSNAEILVTVQAPGSLGWVGFGFGGQMIGSLVFVMWPDDTNVVISSRYASGHYEPGVYDGPQISVLSSNITSDAFVAEVQLNNATTWTDNGSLDIDSSNAGIVWALGLNPPNNPSNPDSDFQIHKTMGVFDINMKSAQTRQTQTASVPTQTGSATTQTAAEPSFPTITGAVSLTPNFKIGLTHRDKVIIAHGTIMGTSFVILLPLGAIIIRFLAPFLPSPAQFHSGLQTFTLLAVLAAMGLGIYLSKGIQFNYFHQIFGITIISLLVLQAFLGFYHHHRFVVDRPSSRRWFTHTHLWLGRLIIPLGIANAGFGLRLALVSWKCVIIWWCVCGALVVAYAIVSIVTYRRRSKQTRGPLVRPGNNPEPYKPTENN